MPNKIHITMFGQFSISYRDKRLCENEYRGSKMISLLEYLISQRGREITQNELIDLLWSDSKILPMHLKRWYTGQERCLTR